MSPIQPDAAPSVAEMREWARGLGLPVPDRGGRLPVGILDRWDREHPDRPARRGRPMPTYSGKWGGPGWPR